MDDLALFLATRDPERVSREWSSARLEDVLRERPTVAMARRVPVKRVRVPSFQVERAERMFAELRGGAA